MDWYRLFRQHILEVIRICSAYLEQAVDMANDCNKYKGLVVYLKKISSCAGGKEVAKRLPIRGDKYISVRVPRWMKCEKWDFKSK